MARGEKKREPTPEERLDRAWDALDEGQLERALELVAEVDPEDPERCVLEANVLLEVDDLAGARAALERAGDADDPEADAQVLWTAGELELRSWNVARARELFERTAARERPAPLLARMALCAELQGDLALADELMLEAARSDPEAWPVPERLSEGEFEAVLDQAIARLPQEFREALDDTQILVDAVPSRALVGSDDVAATPPDVLGLFVGASRLERSHEDALQLPPTIHLFQRNLERAAQGREELIEEIRITLFHEIGHMLGFDEEGVEAMGLE